MVKLKPPLRKSTVLRTKKLTSNMKAAKVARKKDEFASEDTFPMRLGDSFYWRTTKEVKKNPKAKWHVYKPTSSEFKRIQSGK